MSHAKPTSKQIVVKSTKYGDIRSSERHEGGHWQPRSGGAIPSKKDKARDRKADRKAIYNMTGIWVK